MPAAKGRFRAEPSRCGWVWFRNGWEGPVRNRPVGSWGPAVQWKHEANPRGHDPYFGDMTSANPRGHDPYFGDMVDANPGGHDPYFGDMTQMRFGIWDRVPFEIGSCPRICTIDRVPFGIGSCPRICTIDRVPFEIGSCPRICSFDRVPCIWASPFRQEGFPSCPPSSLS